MAVVSGLRQSADDLLSVRLLSSTEVMRVTVMSLQNVSQAKQRGALAAVKFAKILLFDAASVRAFKAKRKQAKPGARARGIDQSSARAWRNLEAKLGQLLTQNDVIEARGIFDSIVQSLLHEHQRHFLHAVQILAPAEVQPFMVIFSRLDAVERHSVISNISHGARTLSAIIGSPK